MITNNTRALHVLDARRSGQTLKQIAEKYGFTKERARQLSLRGLQIEREIVQNDVWFELSVRTRNAIIRNGCEPTPDAVVECYKTVGELRRIPGLGKKGIVNYKLGWSVTPALLEPDGEACLNGSALVPCCTSMSAMRLATDKPPLPQNAPTASDESSAPHSWGTIPRPTPTIATGCNRCPRAAARRSTAGRGDAQTGVAARAASRQTRGIVVDHRLRSDDVARHLRQNQLAGIALLALHAGDGPHAIGDDNLVGRMVSGISAAQDRACTRPRPSPRFAGPSAPPNCADPCS